MDDSIIEDAMARKRAISFLAVSNGGDYISSIDSDIAMEATHYQSGHSWAATPKAFSKFRIERKTTRISRTSALASFFVERYHTACTTPGGKLDREHPAVGMREIMYSSRNGTVLATVQEPKLRWVILLVGVIVILHAIPSISVWKSGSVHQAMQYRFTALELHGSSGPSPANRPGIRQFGLRLHRCDLPLTESAVNSSGPSITISFAHKQAMDGWYFVPLEEDPETYPWRFKLEASDDGFVWRTVGAPAWTATNGWHDFRMDARSDGRMTWDLAPSFPWLLGQTWVPLTNGVLLLLGGLVGMRPRHVVAGEFLLYASGVVAMLLASWSAAHMYVEQNLDQNAMLECLIFAGCRFLLVVSVLFQPKACLRWLLVYGCLVVIANFIYIMCSPHRFTLSYIRCDFIMGCLLNLVNVLWRSWRVACADRAVAGDRRRYEQEWCRVVQSQRASLQELEKRVGRWRLLAGSGQPLHCRHLNSKREHVNETAKGLSTGIHEKGGFFRFSGALDPNAPVVSLDQVRSCSFFSFCLMPRSGQNIRLFYVVMFHDCSFACECRWRANASASWKWLLSFWNMS